MMIPKTIHYCWFGGGELPQQAKKCLESWKQFCPDYEIRCWDEKNAPLTDNLYVQQAYHAKKWAFVSDYVRIKVLEEYGGIYLDTDVELLKSLDAFLEHEVFSGFESREKVATCILGCVPHHPVFTKWAESYSGRAFLQEDGRWDDTTNVIVYTALLEELGLKKDGTKQQVAGVTVYPAEWFSPKSLETGKISLTKNSHAIHYFSASWMPWRNRFNTRLAQLLNPKRTQQIKRLLGRA